MNRLLAAFDTDGGVRLLWWLIGGLLVVAFFSWLALGANNPPDPTIEARDPVPGFGTVGFTVEHGAVTDEFCALFASTDAQRQSGMTGRSDFGGFDAMLFAWPAPVAPAQVSFHNRRVPIALTVAFFDREGDYISLANLEPCEDREGCPAVRALRDFQFALEVPKGGLGRLGVGPGAKLQVGAACRV